MEIEMTGSPKIQRNELKDILDAHQIWLNSEGSQGRRADLSGTDLSYFNLQGAILEKACLRKACFEGANLRSVNLKRADLREAVFQKAGLQWAMLTGADLGGAVLEGTSFNFPILAKPTSIMQISKGHFCTMPISVMPT